MQIEMLGAEAAMIDLAEQSFQTVIEHKDQLLKILDRVIQLKAPRHTALFDIRRQQRHTFLLDGVDNVLEFASIPADKILRGNGQQVLDPLYAEIAENIQRVLFDPEVTQRQLLKHIRSVQSASFSLYSV